MTQELPGLCCPLRQLGSCPAKNAQKVPSLSLCWALVGMWPLDEDQGCPPQKASTMQNPVLPLFLPSYHPDPTQDQNGSGKNTLDFWKEGALGVSWASLSSAYAKRYLLSTHFQVSPLPIWQSCSFHSFFHLESYPVI